MPDFTKNSLSKPPYDPRVVANYLLKWGQDNDIKITQLKLLKLFYFCYGWYLIQNKRPLTKNDFEAWQHGPVSRCIRKEFSQFKSAPITKLAFIRNPYSGDCFYADPSNIANTDIYFLDSILALYGKYSGTELSNLSHEEGSPWDIIWNGKDKKARIGLRISDQDIMTHFELA